MQLCETLVDEGLSDYDRGSAMGVIKMPDILPLISVVMPTYNRAHLIADAINSIFGQTFPNLEVIVVDDGSTDETQRVLAPYMEKITYIRTENRGIAAARNTGMRHASGQYLAWMDSDDMWMPDKLMIQAAYMTSNPDVLMTSTDFSAFNDQGLNEKSHIRSYYTMIDKTPNGFAGIYSACRVFDISALIKPSVSDKVMVNVYFGHIYHRLVAGNCIHPPTVLISRSAAQEVGDIDESLPNVMEYDYFIRMSRAGKIAYLDMPLLYYRYSDDQISSDKHLVDIRLAILKTIQKIQKDDPDYVARNSRFYRQRLAQCHAGVAESMADSDAYIALTHLAKSINLGYFDRRMLKVLAKAVLPLQLLERYRQFKRNLS